ncbi:MAG: hypothetical protein EXS09_20140, partial [Gemmataceae bacterium]|nr:hypothetical protein [Gemmataceae bacterium]
MIANLSNSSSAHAGPLQATDMGFVASAHYPYIQQAEHWDSIPNPQDLRGYLMSKARYMNASDLSRACRSVGSLMEVTTMILSRFVLIFGCFLLTTSLHAADKPVKVFILAGQSNMQGHAHISTFDSMADDPKTAPILKDMRDADGKPRVCEKVWISSIGCLGDAYSDLREQKGKLTAGFGPSGKKIGPEFTFGLTMEKLHDQPILIIKTSWGGRSLHTDFRPPSAGPETFNDFIVGQWKKRGLDVEQESAKINKKAGVFYRHMIEHVQKVLKDIKRVVPDYDEKQGYELAGFVWFQGFNDLVDSWTYHNQMKPGGYDQYGELMAHLIRDVRKDLKAPKLPFVIGVMGIGGMQEGKKAPQMHFRQAQVAPTLLPEFKGNVVAV